MNLELKTKYFKLLIILLLSSLFLVLSSETSCAQEVSLGLYPPIFQIDANPPAQLKTPINIQNNSTDPAVLEISFKPFVSSQANNGQIQFLSDKDLQQGADPNIFQKIQILDDNKSVDQIELGPQETKQLIISVDLPKQEP